MNLTDHDLKILRTFHGLTAEAQEVRARLKAAGLKWCPACQTPLSLHHFNARAAAPDGKQNNCWRCAKTGRAASFTKTGRELITATREALVS